MSYNDERINTTAQLPFEDRYQAFINDIRAYVDEMVSTSVKSPMAENITYSLIGPEFREEEIVKKYGKDVYNKACSEIPEDKEGKWHGIHSKKDFSNADVKLGVIFNEGVRASGLLDLDYFISEFEKHGVPCYIDFETNTFHFNAVPIKNMTR